MGQNPSKIDGFGTRKNGSGGETANLELKSDFRKYFTAETVAKGDIVALDLSATEPANGYMNSVKLCDTGDALNQIALGVVVEGATVSGGIPEEIVVQVSGYCSFAKVISGLGSDDGKLLAASATAGQFGLVDADGAGDGTGFLLPAAIMVNFGTAATADSAVILLNPCNQ